MVKLLLWANGIVYLLLTIDRTAKWGYIDAWCSLIPVAVTKSGEVWRLVTYMFLHSPSPSHIIFNLLVLWMFGAEVEAVLGRWRFLRYYFITGIGAGLCSLAIHPLSISYIMGASGAIYALVLAYAIYFPNRQLLVFFIIPVKAKYVAIGTVVIELFFSISGVEDGIAHLAHLGGLIIGYLLLKHRTLLPDLRYWWLRLKGWWYRRRFKVYTSGKTGRGGSWKVN